eukprot:CAMPEP_0196723818 /NCGR_PEP_ID=MMETSP1091-20130531/5881_1 /TAXON_ID=302021 /ORGANISM="Rhodomonas sp., Strain CCMP768" /LENGTH=420 /DNA_ID=CAMNT_0042065851 /DNA_START=275 /DNA_END=1537 /DNA_ORIENTATION=+
MAQMASRRSSGPEAIEQIWTGDGAHCSHWHPLFVPPPLPLNEEQRLKVLREQEILDTADEEQFDSLALLAKKAFQADSALISLVDGSRAWFKARVGFSAREVHRDIAFCSHALLQEDLEPFVVLDAAEDDRFRFNQLTTGPEAIAFYAGAPLLVHRDGTQYVIGCLSICDRAPRDAFPPTEAAYLAVLASAVVREMELRPRRPAIDQEGVAERVMMLENFFARSNIHVEPSLIQIIAQKAEPRVVQSEHFVTRRGDPGDSMYFLSRGSCSCTLNGRELERLPAGACFGELAIMNMCRMRAANVNEKTIQKRCVRSADVRARERCELLQVSFRDAWPLLHKYPVFWKLLEAISDTRMQRISRFSDDSSDQAEHGVKDSRGSAESFSEASAAPALPEVSSSTNGPDTRVSKSPQGPDSGEAT